MPEYYLDDTIAAIATPFGEGGISVIRVSGEKAFKIVSKIFSNKKLDKIEDCPTHTIHLGNIIDTNKKIIDQVLISIFKAPNSYTGENVIEISSHGGQAVTKKILELLIQSGARYAEPGEFTKRAFFNGKIDLTQAEAVLDLIQAKSQRSLDVAIQQLTGSLSRKLKSVKDQMMKLYGHMEAYLDFPEDDLEIYSNNEITNNLNKIKNEIDHLIESFKRASLLREGVAAVIVGTPNVGKSSFFNELLERDRALVSAFPGTTRDHLEESLDIKGITIRLTDTAGLISTPEHPLDQMGMQRTRETIEKAHLTLFVVDGSRELKESDKWIFRELDHDKPVLVLINKSDLEIKLDLTELETLIQNKKYIFISTKTRKGFSEFSDEIFNILLGNDFEMPSEQITRMRHKNALEEASETISRAQKAFQEKESLDCVILEIKTAIDLLRELIGEVYSEDLLDVIFSEFCIGK